MKKYIFLLSIFIASVNIQAQEQIKGKVVELMKNGSERPIPGANVYWEGTTIGVSTNNKGFYLIPEPQNYPAKLVVSFVGYQKHIQLINELNEYNIILSPSIELNQVEIESKVNTTKWSTVNPVNIQVLSTAELEKAACCNLSESFGTNASVDVNFTDAVSGAKTIKMLGLDGVYAQITQENMPLIRGMSSSFGLNYVPGTWIESIQIIKGTGSVVNGFESLVGQINLEYFKPESAPKLFWNMYTNSHGKVENNLQFAKKKGNWKSNLFTHISSFQQELDHHGGGSHDHTIYTNHIDPDGFMDQPKVNQLNVLNRWEYKDKKYHIAFTGRALLDDRIAGTTKNADKPYIVDIHNDLIEFTSKTGMILPSLPGKSVGLQTLFRRHNQAALFGDNDYKGLAESAYLNLISQTYINNTNHTLKYGISYYADRYTESFSGYDFNDPFSDKIRVDLMTGIFSEYVFKMRENFNLIGGLRADYYNNTGEINYLPRLNIKYNPTENTALRFSAGRAFRIANVFVENTSLFASNRSIILEELAPEIAWNYGTNLIYCFRFLGREGIFNADVYRTIFENQVVVDIETPSELMFYNLNGESFANTIQIDIGYELFTRFDIKIAYKINNVRTTFRGIDKAVPLLPKEHGLFNLAYATNFEKWKFDFTGNYIGKRRIPEHEKLIELSAESFYLYNAQITKRFRYFDAYLGGENLLGYTQDIPILDNNNPNSSIFDASLIHAPINGLMMYVGFRYKIK